MCGTSYQFSLLAMMLHRFTLNPVVISANTLPSLKLYLVLTIAVNFLYANITNKKTSFRNKKNDIQNVKVRVVNFQLSILIEFKHTCNAFNAFSHSAGEQYIQEKQFYHPILLTSIQRNEIQQNFESVVCDYDVCISVYSDVQPQFCLWL